MLASFLLQLLHLHQPRQQYHRIGVRTTEPLNQQLTVPYRFQQLEPVEVVMERPDIACEYPSKDSQNHHEPRKVIKEAEVPTICCA